MRRRSASAPRDLRRRPRAGDLAAVRVPERDFDAEREPGRFFLDLLISEDADAEIGNPRALRDQNERLLALGFRACGALAGVARDEQRHEVVPVERRKRRKRWTRRSNDCQGARERLDGKRANDCLGCIRLALRSGQTALLPQPLDRGLDPVRLARLTEIGAARHEIAKRTSVFLGGACNLEDRACRDEACEDLPCCDLQLPAHAVCIRSESVRGMVAGTERARPGDYLRDGETVLRRARAGRLDQTGTAARVLEDQVGKEPRRLAFGLGGRLQSRGLGSRRVRPHDDGDVPLHVERLLRLGAPRRGQYENGSAGTDPTEHEHIRLHEKSR